MKISLSEQIGLAQQDKSRNSSFVEKPQSADVLFVQRCSGVDQQKREIAGGKIGECLCSAAFRQRTQALECLPAECPV